MDELTTKNDSPNMDAVLERSEEIKWELVSKQNMPMGVLYGVVAMLFSAFIWAVIAYLLSVEIGWLAIGVGYLVGIAVLKGGKGVKTTYGVIGAVLALLAILIGKYFTIVAYFSKEFEVSFFEVMTSLSFDDILELLKLTFSPIDLLFYGFAVYEGFKFSFTPLPVAIADEKLADS